MKKFSLIMLVLALALGLAFLSCDDGTTNDGGGNTPSGNNPGNGNTSGGNTPGNGGDTASFQGTYTGLGGTVSIIATGSSYSYYGLGVLLEKGTFTVSGTTIYAKVTEVYEYWEGGVHLYTGSKVGDINTLTLINENTIFEPGTGQTYTKVR